MKEGWEYLPLEQIIDNLRTGLNPRVHFQLNTPDAKGYYITVRELKGWDFQVDEKTDRINEKAIKRINERSNLLIGDILYSGTGTIGNTAIVREMPTWWNIKEGVYAITPTQNLVSSEFLVYAFNSLKSEIQAKATGATIKSVPMKVLRKIVFPVPPLSEQQSIVEYLDSSFAKIDAMKANAEKALNEAKALFQASLKSLLEPKEGWEEKELNNVSLSITDGDHMPPPKASCGIPFITISNIVKESTSIDFRGTFFVPQSYYDNLKSTRKPQRNDVLYTVTGSFGIPVLVETDDMFCFQRHIALVRPNNAILDSRFLYYWFLSPSAYKLADDVATGAAQRTVSLTSLRSFVISYPALDVQQSIIASLDAIKLKILKLQSNFDKITKECDALKQALLKQVFE